MIRAIVYPIALILFVGLCFAIGNMHYRPHAVFCATDQRITVMAEVDDAKLVDGGMYFKTDSQWQFYEKQAAEACMSLDKMPTIQEPAPANPKKELTLAPRKVVDKPFASGTMSKAAFFSFLRSALRQKSRRWKPIYDCLNEAKRPSKSKNKRLRWEYSCSVCGKWFPKDSVSIDHVVPCGSLNELEDLPGFVKRLFVEKEGLQCICSTCHDAKTLKERKKNDQ